MTDKYSPQEIEKKWQQRWAEDGLYETTEDLPNPKYYALTMLPYTSGDLHIGHWYNYVPPDVHARFRRMRGYNVFHPIGFDSFGLPAENAAIRSGIHPSKWTEENIANLRDQLKSIGAMYDWNREVITSEPEYYRWTQWLFLKLYEHDLAYRKKAPVNWCPSCQTVLANEQVIDNRCERCDSPVSQQDREQWFFRITKYAEELMKHDGIDWPERTKLMQVNWIGKSTGADISFELDISGVEEKEIRVFTTRPDTTYGVTFMVLAPEHPLVAKITTTEKKAEVEQYVEKSREQTEIERLSTEKEKDGVFTGAYVTNRLNGEKVPVWIADYVLLSYGTGAVMAVPAHDERDFAFAKKYNIPIRIVIAPEGYSGEVLEEAYTGPGTMINSEQFDGIPSQEGINEVSDYLAEKGWGGPTTTYRLRDWLISRQRYWGAPIPMVYCDECGLIPVREEDLPVLLPEDAEFKPTGESPLAYSRSFVNTTCPKCGKPARRETDTMDTFMCSSWYFLRYCSPHENDKPYDPEKVKYWMPVDLYTGGIEHAVMHLLYARFFCKALRDMGLVDFDEPFTRLFNQGIIIREHQKMSKSRGNVITPDDLVNELGADTVRTYLMFLGPWDQGGDWSDTGISGMSRWLNRLWGMMTDPYHANHVDNKTEKDLIRFTHQVIRKITDDLEKLRFNTMVASLMEFSNYLSTLKNEGKVGKKVWKESVKTLLLLLAPSVPHFAEELWERTGNSYSIHTQDWPQWDDELAKDEEITLVVQVNGKLRDRISVAASITEAEAVEKARTSEKVKSHIEGKTTVKEIFVPGKLVNIVVR
ncbi:MAG: leucine--tRNA ligase [Dehalococcoidales bacterium]|nr:leucine--tRNA ligase [Dehalococcoidales bacterium]